MAKHKYSVRYGDNTVTGDVFAASREYAAAKAEDLFLEADRYDDAAIAAMEAAIVDHEVRTDPLRLWLKAEALRALARVYLGE